MRYHGNYCGPNWSDGKVQESVAGLTEPIDALDKTCRLHDLHYALGDDKTTADVDFVRSNFGAGLKETAAALVVGTQSILRTIDNSLLITNIHELSTSIKQKLSTITNMPQKTKSIRGQKQPTKPSMKSANLSKNGGVSQVTTVPAAYGFSLRLGAPSVTRNGSTATIRGADYAGTVFASNTSLYTPAASVLLNPIYFQNGMLGSLSRTYEKFRFTKAVIEYVPSVPTSTQGQVIMTSTRTVKEPFINASSTTFLSRALSQGNAVATPIWKQDTITVSCSNEWSIVDALLDADLDDCIQEEIQVYTTCEATLNAGILILHYEIQFKDPLFTYHPTVIPCPVGNGSIVSFNDDTAANIVNISIRLAAPTISMTALGTGGIYRAVFIQQRSILPAPIVSWGSVARITGQLGTDATGTTTTNTVDINMASGTVFYLLEFGPTWSMYASYEGAANGDVNDLICYTNITSAVGTYTFLVSGVRLGHALRITTQ